jgi:nucleoside-diphosphate-sugar epimerase
VPPARRDIAMVFQDYALYPHMTVHDNMAFGLEMRNTPKDEIRRRVQRAAEQLHITEYLQRKPRELSGGQRQRVAMGRAMVREPQVFLFDEPLSNLDAKLRGEVRTEIKALAQTLQTTMVFVTHDQVEAMTMADRIVILKDGVVQQVGTPQQVYDEPVNAFVAGFIGSPTMNFLDAAVRTGCGRFVFASSGGVLYGDVTAPAPEATPANPVSPYGITKWVGERYLKFYAEEHGLAAVALRYSNVYGPRQNPHGEAGVVAIFCKKLLAGEPATINGDGRYVRDYVYGPDVARANLIAITADLPAIQPKTLTSLNIGTGLGTDVNELEAQLRQALAATLADRGRSAPLPPPLHGPARPGDLRSNLVDASRAAQLLGWKPTVSFADGLASTATWFADR